MGYGNESCCNSSINLLTIYNFDTRSWNPQFASLTNPLNKLLQKGYIWKWNDKCQEAMNAIKRKLTEYPILQHTDYSKPFILQTDASNLDPGFIILQIDNENREYIVAYTSCSFNKAEWCYSAIKLEVTAILWAVVTKSILWSCYFTEISV